MAKQTFTNGDVLTASAMTSLQSTAMQGGSTSDKTTSYVLLAADAGTMVRMNAAGSTTITVNNSIFSSGDTVYISNIGAGTTTITAGAGVTINTGGSLAVTQYDGGILYFNSASNATYFDYVQPSTSSPLTTKGDLYTRSASADARLGVGTDGQILIADSTASTGLKWGTSSASLVGCSAYIDSASQSITADVATGILMTSEVFDTDGFHSTSSNTSRFTIPTGKGGKYLCQGSYWLTASSTYRQLRIYKNGSAINTLGFTAGLIGQGQDTYSWLQGTAILDLAVGDYIEFMCLVSGTGKTLNQANGSIIYLGA